MHAHSKAQMPKATNRLQGLRARDRSSESISIEVQETRHGKMKSQSYHISVWLKANHFTLGDQETNKCCIVEYRSEDGKRLKQR